MPSTSPILRSFDLERTGESSFRGESVHEERRPVVFGGQLMGQMIVAASRSESAKSVKSLHVIFAKSGTTTRPVEIALEPIHSGRSFASLVATASQGDRVLSRGMALLHVAEPDVIRHQVPVPLATGPLDAPQMPSPYPGAELRLVDGVDLMTTAATGEPEVHVWVRFTDVPAEQAQHQALLSWFTDGFLIAAAMRPHEGIGQSQAHESLSTGVIAHTLSFHEPVQADQWMLISNRSLHAGAGRSYGEGHVFTADGRLIASFTQENMIRYFPDKADGRGKPAL
jgi:acyl-CoA thioesterase-2